MSNQGERRIADSSFDDIFKRNIYRSIVSVALSTPEDAFSRAPILLTLTIEPFGIGNQKNQTCSVICSICLLTQRKLRLY